MDTMHSLQGSALLPGCRKQNHIYATDAAFHFHPGEDTRRDEAPTVHVQQGSRACTLKPGKEGGGIQEKPGSAKAKHPRPAVLPFHVRRQEKTGS